MEKQTFTHRHEMGAVNVPVLKHEIKFCNTHVKPGQGWWFQTSPFPSRKQRRHIINESESIKESRGVKNNRRPTRGRLAYRLKNGGLPFPQRMVSALSKIKVDTHGIVTKLKSVIQKVLGGRRLRLS